MPIFSSSRRLQARDQPAAPTERWQPTKLVETGPESSTYSTTWDEFKIGPDTLQANTRARMGLDAWAIHMHQIGTDDCRSSR